MKLPTLRCCICGAEDLVAASAGRAPIFGEVRPWTGLPDISERVRRPIRIPLHRGEPIRAWCLAHWPNRPQEHAPCDVVGG